jgi:hypothetical protein
MSGKCGWCGKWRGLRGRLCYECEERWLTYGRTNAGSGTTKLHGDGVGTNQRRESRTIAGAADNAGDTNVSKRRSN